MKPLQISFAYLLLSLTVGFAACKKDKPETSSKKVLSPDAVSSQPKPKDQMFDGRPYAPPKPPPKHIDVVAEAEETVAKEPIELTLRLYKKKIKLGEHAWFQLQLKNIGKEKQWFADDVFYDSWQLAENHRTTVGVYIEVIGPDKELLSSYIDKSLGLDLSKKPEPPDPVEMQKVQAMVDEWTKAGLSDTEINDKLFEYDKNKPRPAKPGTILKPGESISSQPWFYDHRFRHSKGWQPPKEAKNFAELTVFKFHVPGEYRLRAVYDLAPSDPRELEKLQKELEALNPEKAEILKKLPKEPKRQPRPKEITIRTSWIDIEVLP